LLSKVTAFQSEKRIVAEWLDCKSTLAAVAAITTVLTVINASPWAETRGYHIGRADRTGE